MKLSLSRSDDADLPWLRPSVVDKIRSIGALLGPSSETVNLVVVDDTFIRTLNRDYRDIDKPTDVISFSYLGEDTPRLQAEDDLAGEVYISYQTIQKEAEMLGVDPAILFLRIGVHGILHVVGYDHVSAEDASRMEGKEKSLLTTCLAPEEFDNLFQE